MSKITNNADIIQLKKLLKEVDRMRQNVISCYVKSCIQKQEIPEIREQLAENKDKIINSFCTIFQKIPGGNYVVIDACEFSTLFPKIFDDDKEFFEVFDMKLIKCTKKQYQVVANFMAELYQAKKIGNQDIISTKYEKQS